MARYRLRFLLQEIDVHRGVTILGRSPECQVTIEDPLVSRQHARIVIDDDGVRIEDLKSRNGVKLNGRPIRGISPLKDNDRLRIGTQELVFCELPDGVATMASSKTTGFLRHCARCRMPYPQEMMACPNCGETMQLEEDTMTGQLGADTSRSWSLQLLLEVLDKALALGRHPDAIRALQRAQVQVEERLVTGEPFDGKQLNEVVLAALQIAAVVHDAAPVAWALRLYKRAKSGPSGAVIDEIDTIVAAYKGEMRPALEELLAYLSQIGHPSAGRVQQILTAASSESANAPDDPDPDQTKSNPALS